MMEFAELPNWKFYIEEVSASVYEIIGRHSLGYAVCVKGSDFENILDGCKAEAKVISENFL